MEVAVTHRAERNTAVRRRRRRHLPVNTDVSVGRGGPAGSACESAPTQTERQDKQVDFKKSVLRSEPLLTFHLLHCLICTLQYTHLKMLKSQTSRLYLLMLRQFP